MYGIGLQYLVNPHGWNTQLVGVKCCAMQSWGFPRLFKSMPEAREWGNRHYGHEKKSTVMWDIISQRTAELYCKIMVETVSGRRVYHPGTGEWSVDATRQTYEQMLPLLTNMRDRAERDQFWLKNRRRHATRYTGASYGKMTFDFS